jgi:eukaryotic-like serine/threonine-protein kinase
MTRVSSGPASARTLRSQIEERRAQGRLHSLKETVGIIVPLAVELAQRHAAGETFYLHPSSIVSTGPGAWHLSPTLSQRAPAHPKDKACMAPEERDGHAGNARSSVFAVGAMLYELCTGQVVGPGMRRPTEVIPQLPAELDLILAKALVGDPVHRPDDLKALAMAIHHLSPTGSIPPPPADESHLDHDENFEVDVSLSMVPPAPKATSPGAFGVDVRTVTARPTGMDQATGALTELKQRLESDPRPRYVVIREGMDHGPFNAVELLQQIASHTFKETDLLRDVFSQDERLISAWDEFAPFAEHARRHRDIAAEKVAIEKTVEIEKKSTRGKALIGLTAVGVLVVAGAAWFLVKAGTRKDDVAVQSDTVTAVEAEGNLNVPKSRGGKGGGRRVVGEQGGVPLLAGGMSCEAAQAAYVEEISIGGAKVPADITSSQYGSILNGGGYLNGCGLPSSTGVDVCVAVQNGRAVGVTIHTKPSNPGVASCIASHVRGLSFPAHPKLDVTRTSFAPQ